jgi:hypothetical protein
MTTLSISSLTNIPRFVHVENFILMSFQDVNKTKSMRWYLYKSESDAETGQVRSYSME